MIARLFSFVINYRLNILFRPEERMVITVKAYQNNVLLHKNVADDPEIMKAFQDAIQDPEKRQQIISILEEAGLLPGLIRQPA